MENKKTDRLEDLRRVLGKRLIKAKNHKLKDVSLGIHVSYTNLSKKLNGTLPFSEKDLTDVLHVLKLQFDTSMNLVERSQTFIEDVSKALELKKMDEVDSLLQAAMNYYAAIPSNAVTYAEPYKVILEFYKKIRDQIPDDLSSYIESIQSYLDFLTYDEQAFALDLIGYYYYYIGMDDKALEFYESAIHKCDRSYINSYGNVIRFHILTCSNSIRSPYEGLVQCRELHNAFSSLHNVERMLDTSELEIEYLCRMGAYGDCEKIGANLLRQMDHLSYTGSSRILLLQYLAWAKISAGKFEEALEVMNNPAMTYDNSGNTLCYRVFCYYKLNRIDDVFKELPRCLSSITEKADKDFILLIEDLVSNRSVGFLKRYEVLKKSISSSMYPIIMTWADQLLADYYIKNQNLEKAVEVLKRISNPH